MKPNDIEDKFVEELEDGWHFLDETYNYDDGAYSTRIEAKEALLKYFNELSKS